MNQMSGTGMSHSQLRRHRKEKLRDSVRRLAVSAGVFGVMVTTEEWNVIESTFDHNLTHFWKRQMKFVEELGVASVRDADPKNNLHFLRLQTRKFEILVSIAKDHRVLVVFSNAPKDPLRNAVLALKQQKKEQWNLIKAGKRVRMTLDPCRPHTKLIGGKETVIITEKISGNLVDQKVDINNI